MLMENLCRNAVRPGSFGNSNQIENFINMDQQDIQNWTWATKLSISFQGFQDLDLCIFLEAAGCAVCSSGTYSEDFDDDGKTRRCAKCSPGYSQGKGLAKLP